MVLTRTPLRVSLLGGGTDYPEWFMEHEGAVLGMAIDKFVYCRIQPMMIGTDLRYQVRYSIIDDSHCVEHIKHPVIRSALQYYNIDTPLLFTCFGDLPGRAGLGSSSSFCVGALKALQEHANLPIAYSPFDLAGEAISFERCIIPEIVGVQDQIFAAVGGLNFITFDKNGAKVQRLELSAERLLSLEQSLILVYTGSMRDANMMAKKQVLEIPQKNGALTHLTELATFGRDALLDETRPLSQLGTALSAAWRAKVELCPEVTTPTIDAIYQHGLQCGALGGKLLGAGGGGFFLFFVPPNRRTQFELEIGSPHVNIHIATVGSQVIPH